MSNERRKHPRFPTAASLDKLAAKAEIAQPINLHFGGVGTVPSVLLDLSAGGMGLLTFMPVKNGCEIKLKIDLPGLKTDLIEGVVAWTLQKGESYRLGIEFSKINKKDSDMIKHMSSDYVNCEMRIIKDEKPVCLKNCQYHLSCSKDQKKNFAH